MTVGKKKLIDYIEKTSNLSKKEAEIALRQVLHGISIYLSAGKKVQIIGFGSFSTKKSKAREVKNPRTGQKIQIPEKNKVFFKSGNALKESVNNQ